MDNNNNAMQIIITLLNRSKSRVSWTQWTTYASKAMEFFYLQLLWPLCTKVRRQPIKRKWTPCSRILSRRSGQWVHFRTPSTFLIPPSPSHLPARELIHLTYSLHSLLPLDFQSDTCLSFQTKVCHSHPPPPPNAHCLYLSNIILHSDNSWSIYLTATPPHPDPLLYFPSMDGTSRQAFPLRPRVPARAVWEQTVT